MGRDGADGSPMVTPNCGGCRGMGNHRTLCPRHPDYHPWKRLEYSATNIGDSIGGNDPGLANVAYSLAAEIGERIRRAQSDT